MFGYYLIKFNLLGLFYVGSSDDLNRRKNEHLYELRRGSHVNKRMQAAFDCDSNPEFEFYPTASREEAYAIEQSLLKSNSLNGSLLNDLMVVTVVSDETKSRISQALMNHPVTAESRARMGESKKGNDFWVGKKHRPESIEKMSASQLGNSNAKGHSVSEEQRQKLRERATGRVMSAETRLKVSMNSASSKKVEINGVVYRSMREAGEAVGKSGDTIRKRCESTDPEWSGYNFS